MKILMRLIITDLSLSQVVRSKNKMKKWIVLLFCSFSVLASPKETLSQRLALTEGFSAQFDQQVLSPEGETVMEGKGTVEAGSSGIVSLGNPEPDENILVSDGQTLWYYSPFIEQVSIYNQQQATEQTPFILLTRNQASDWNAYTSRS
ncbi:outer membrane lipoprotein chaperone LolA [Vibrio metschnikovii]